MIKKTIFFLVLIGFYIVAINLTASISNIDLKIEESQEKISSGFIKADLGHSVSVTVERKWSFKRPYGKIVETDGISDIYLLKFIKLPLNSEKINFRTSHKIFFGFISIFYIIVFFKVSKNKKQQRRYQYEMV